MSDREVVLRAAGVSKKFCRTLKHAMKYGILDVVRGGLGLRQNRGQLRANEFWAVKDVTLELRRGEALGVIGKNGSGKSTLLSLLNGIYRPDEGRIETRGRVGALIQLGAGFHPLLTGRENIYVNGAILGLKKREIDRRLNAIIDFAGIGEFIDSPVRNYSSGMFARLGFSVAIHTDPDVLLVDEVLSVGDAEFRARAMERMWQLREEGVAVVFVSHNIQAVLGFCGPVLLLDRGIPQIGGTTQLVAQYCGGDVEARYSRVAPEAQAFLRRRDSFAEAASTGDIEIEEVIVSDEDGVPRSAFSPTSHVRGSVHFRARRSLPRVLMSLCLFDPAGVVVWVDRTPTFATVEQRSDRGGSQGGRIVFELTPLQLKTGRYILGIAFNDPSLEAVYAMDRGTILEVCGSPNPAGDMGFFEPRLTWHRVDGVQQH